MAESRKSIVVIQAHEWRKLIFELVVVFLGVTAGFLLNNWQLHRQDRVLEQKYLIGFVQDIQVNIAELEQAVTTDSLWLKRALPRLREIQHGTISRDSAEAAVTMLVEISKAGIQTGTYEAITNSGNLNLITRFDVKKQIVDYHVAINDVRFVEDYFYRYFSDLLMPFVFNHFSVLNRKLTDPEIIRTTQFENVFAGYYSMIQQRLAAYRELLVSSRKLEKLLQQIQ